MGGGHGQGSGQGKNQVWYQINPEWQEKLEVLFGIRPYSPAGAAPAAPAAPAPAPRAAPGGAPAEEEKVAEFKVPKPKPVQKKMMTLSQFAGKSGTTTGKYLGKQMKVTWDTLGRLPQKEITFAEFAAEFMKGANTTIKLKSTTKTGKLAASYLWSKLAHQDKNDRKFGISR